MFAPVADARSIVRRLYGVEPTSWKRDPNSALGRANPRSWHNRTGAAVDVAPIKGMDFGQYVDGFKKAGYGIIESLDEQKHPLAHTTGPNWHVVLDDNKGKMTPMTLSSFAPKPKTLADLVPYAMDVNGQRTPQMNVPNEDPFNAASLMGDPIANQAATLGDLVQNTGLPAPKQKFFGKGGPGTYLLGGLADGLTMWASGGQQRGQAIPSMQQMAANEEERTYDLQRRREELDARKDAAMQAAAKPYRFQNNNGDVVEVNPATGQTSVLYADPSPKPNWMRVENADGSVTMQPGAGGVRPSQAHIEALQSNPNMAADFDAKFGRGMAQYYLGGR